MTTVYRICSRNPFCIATESILLCVFVVLFLLFDAAVKRERAVAGKSTEGTTSPGPYVHQTTRQPDHPSGKSVSLEETKTHIRINPWSAQTRFATSTNWPQHELIPDNYDYRNEIPLSLDNIATCHVCSAYSFFFINAVTRASSSSACC